MKPYLFLLVLLFLGASCGSSKKAMGTAVVAERLAANKVAKKHLATNFDKESVEAKLKVVYQDAKNKQSVSVKLRLQKDSVIWLNATYAGFLVARAKITPTRVSYYEKLNKTYFDGDFTLLRNVLGTEVNFNQLQSMLLGQAIVNIGDQDFSSKLENNAHLLTPEKQNPLFDLLFWINPQHFKLDKQALKNSAKNQLLEVEYHGYSDFDGTFFPKEIVIEGKQAEKVTQITIAYKSVDFNVQFNTPYSIPRGYKKIVFDE
ncbi:hypothetical protein GCM10011416_08750 [Polaribacter pacificus]|uniref:Deoxyuridine 5'-triphosphate nucleotidohydrolase n=1 Tax=Polaribacter pacificus TaxID=1775173 RepID=A0A917HWD0_9FLAO|nr:DUF4292 domain-containing protein [Polaribacter pacificus]GGG93772.1 hypothetical protein GCM10011416_08750 [Polaribacter pacificus]